MDTKETIDVRVSSSFQKKKKKKKKKKSLSFTQICIKDVYGLIEISVLSLKTASQDLFHPLTQSAKFIFFHYSVHIILTVFNLGGYIVHHIRMEVTSRHDHTVDWDAKQYNKQTNKKTNGV